MFVLSGIALAFLGGLFASDKPQWEFSVPEAPFSVDREVKDGVAATPVVNKAGIRVGSRMVNASGSILSFMVNGNRVLDVTSRINCNKDWDGVGSFETTLTADGKGLHRVYTHDAKRSKDGRECKFESDIRLMPNGEIELTVFNPDSEPKRGCTQFHLYMPVAMWHDQFVSINGSAPFRVPPSAHQWNLTPFPADMKMSSHVYPRESTFVFYKPDGKTKRFAMRLGENAGGGCIQRGGAKTVQLNFTIVDLSKPAKFYVDLGDTRVPREKPHLVGGVNFLEENDGDAPCWDESKNLLINGGFESGTRYWKARIRLVEDAHSGRYAATTPEWFDSSIKSVGVVLKPDAWYTVGAWIKSTDGKPVSVGVHPRGAYGGYSGFLDNVPLRHKGGKDWQFAQKSFKTKSITSETVLWISCAGGKALIDDLCLVEGSNTVATATNPWGMEIRTGAEDNLFVPAERTDGKIQLLVRGPKGAKAKLDITGSDLLGRKTIAKKATVTIPTAGETLVDLGPDTAFPKGVNGIKVKLDPVHSSPSPSTFASLPYTDYLRFNKAKWGDNQQKHRYFQTDPDGPAFVGTMARNPESYAKRIKRDIMLGMGCISYTCTWIGDDYFTDAEEKLLAENGVKDFWGAVRTGKNWKQWLNGKPWEWNGTNINNFVEYPDDLLKWVENETFEYAKKIPWRTYWSFDSEPAGHHASLRAGRFDQYARLLKAMNDGLKRANPKNEFCPYGTWNMGNGTHEIAAILKELKRIDPETHYKYVEVHSYREFPEDPDVQVDLDNFFSRLSSAGYDDIQIRVGEGSYYFPMFRPSKGMFPWSGVSGHDGYSGFVMPGYDLGFGEKIGAALTTRETAIYYKNDNRIFNNCSWNPRWVDNDTPCGWLLANVALLEMLGDAKYLGEVRFSQNNSRAMFFDDGHGALTVFMWRGDTVFDKGMAGPVEAEIDFGDIKPEFYDLYANRCRPFVKPTTNNQQPTTILPLSGYPIYIKLPKEQIGKAKAFKDAIAQTRVAADLNKLPLSCSLTLKDPSTVEVKAVNTLSRTVEADVTVDGAAKGKMTFPGMQAVSFDVTLAKPIDRAAYTQVKVPVKFVYEGKIFEETFETSAVTVGYVAGEKPDWDKIPAVNLYDWSCWHQVGKHKSNKEFSGTVKLAWNDKHLWMKFDVKDDLLMLAKNPKDWQTWGSDSDMVYLYFDGYANAREKFKRGQKGYDFDDFSFGVFPLSKDRADIIRSRAPDHQLTGGAGYGFVKGPEPNVKTTFAADSEGYELTLDFPAYYMMPVKLEAGGISPGFCAIVYDRDQDQHPPRKAVKNYMGAGPEEKPENWPQLIFTK